MFLLKLSKSRSDSNAKLFLKSLYVRNLFPYCLPGLSLKISTYTILQYLNVSAKSILTTKRNIKSYFYSKLKPKYNAVWKAIWK
jgi:hypothetical protein